MHHVYPWRTYIKDNILYNYFTRNIDHNLAAEQSTGEDMDKLILKLLSVLVLVISATGQANASVVQSADLTMSYRDFLFTETSQHGDSFTFAFVNPDWLPYGNIVLAISRYAFDFAALPGYSLTGKMSVQLDASYQLNASAGASAQMQLAFDVLIPLCDQCGPDDGIYVNSAGGFATSTADPAGSLSIDTGNSAVSGSYERLIMYVVNDFILTNGYGQINFNSITFTAEAVRVSAVPEVPPYAMLASGLALIGAGVRAKRQKAFDAPST